ncbi:MAG: hypothetical protein U1E06_21805 [Tabrizicola sp.]|uniref:hypothetical protein n=1 Tax=Tabrizicola sp. TaxID=2005166 RepID=UPI00273553EE|nr:hypothetical protein [Tabrizicola sp.]MDP3263233.1 hypothetical protein [Tabrizicola sp.]MDP3646590.1 hypothetical protein [Paracoccaceae bacterium]MDZ4069439.1 hypothetical protein [Tabrizicola sp.]
MRRLKRPMFLARAPYRRRRLRDAARLLPVFGAALLILPLLWADEGAERRLSSSDVIYFFALWCLLIVVAALFAPGLRSGEAAGDETD